MVSHFPLIPPWRWIHSYQTLVAVALHEIADRLGDQGLQAGRRGNRAGPRSGYSADSDARCVSLHSRCRSVPNVIPCSTTSSHDRDYLHNSAPLIAGNRRQEQLSYASDTDYHRDSTRYYPDTAPRPRHRRSDTERRVDSHHLEPRVDSHHSGPHVSAHRMEPRFSAHRVEPHVGAHRVEPRVGAHRVEPHVGTHRTEPRVANRRFYDTRHDLGRGTRSNHSSPPSPTPLSRTFSHQPPNPSTGLHLEAPIITQSCSYLQAETRKPVFEVTDDFDLGDIYDLDVAYVQLRDPGCVREIHTPPLGKRGPLGRWYFVCVGKTVGIFNNW